MIENSWNP